MNQYRTPFMPRAEVKCAMGQVVVRGIRLNVLLNIATDEIFKSAKKIKFKPGNVKYTYLAATPIANKIREQYPTISDHLKRAN